ncbi:unnamed protein product [Ixodes pacificus]
MGMLSPHPKQLPQSSRLPMHLLSLSLQRTRQRCAINGTYRCHIALKADVPFAVYTFPHSFLSLILSTFQLTPTRLLLQFNRGKRKEDYLDGWMDANACTLYNGR